MEAKVDIRKLQLLNDRINQTIDALNQVRLTVHGLGLGHSNPYQQMPPYLGGNFFGAQMGQQPFGQPYGQQYGQQGIGQQFGGVSPFTQGGIGGGLQHSNPFSNPFTQGIGGQQFGGVSPFGQGIGGQHPLLQTLGYGGVGGGVGGIGGLLHSNPEAVIENQIFLARASDPNRITATFPFAMQPQSPVGGWW
jgi:hypothetical protein